MAHVNWNLAGTQDGVPKLLDFGIAKQLSPLDDAGASTVTGTAPRRVR